MYRKRVVLPVTFLLRPLFSAPSLWCQGSFTHGSFAVNHAKELSSFLQGCVLTSLLYTYVCVPSHHAKIIAKPTDDNWVSSVVDLVTSDDESACKEEVQGLQTWCSTWGSTTWERNETFPGWKLVPSSLKWSLSKDALSGNTKTGVRWAQKNYVWRAMTDLRSSVNDHEKQKTFTLTKRTRLLKKKQQKERN